MASPRAAEVDYVSPEKVVDIGLWVLFAGAATFVSLRIWSKFLRRHGLWYDDYVLILSLLVLMTTDIIITCEYASGYSTGSWNDRMHILINTSSVGTLLGQATSKSALGITLLRMSNRTQKMLLLFCIISMDVIAIMKVFFQWSKYCGKDSYQQWYRIQGPCINYKIEERIKVVGQVYNIVMDFIFACFPWWITWNLRMRRIEKIALCGTMSLGMFVAILSAVRTAWSTRPIMHYHDEWYMWRNGLNNIWFSAEVSGTIIVQCIPVLRPLIKDIHTSLTSRKLDDEIETGRKSSILVVNRSSAYKNVLWDENTKEDDGIALHVIPGSSAIRTEISSDSRTSKENNSWPMGTIPEEAHYDKQ